MAHASRQSRHHTPGCDLADRIIALIRYIDVARGVHGHTVRAAKLCGGASVVLTAPYPSRPREGAHRSVRRDLPDRVIPGIGHKDVAQRVHRDARREVEVCGAAFAVVAPDHAR